MANLLVEIGNTALKAAWCEETTLGKTYRYQGEKHIEFILKITSEEKPDVLTVASSNVIQDSDRAVLEKECRHLLVLDPAHTSMLLLYDLPEYLSYDRAASIVAVKHLFENKSCTIMDFGTTLNVDFVNSTGRYAGGNVTPGCRTRFKALNRYSRNLPLADVPSEIRMEGHSLESSVQSGVILGIMFEIEGYTRLYPDNILVLTGGDASYFAKKNKNSIFVIPNLVMIGMAFITCDYVKKALQ